MKKIIALCLLFNCLSAFAQKKSDRIVIGTVDTVYSRILKEKRPVYIHVPVGGKNECYPVLYILDGEDHFQSATAIVQQMAGVIPDMIVVGIVNTVRERDLTPTQAKGNEISGGGEAFLSFIEKELMPYIDAKYPAAPYRVFSGHSLGGLTVVNALINHSELFNAYIAIDPSLWWDKQTLLKQSHVQLYVQTFKDRSLFVAFANNMPPGVDTITVMKDTTNGRTMVTRSVIPFIADLKNAGNNYLRWSYKFYPNERHGTIELNAEYDALRYLFNYYQFLTSQFDEHPELNVDWVLSEHFKTISEKLGYKVVPSESLVNQLAYTCMGQKKMEDAGQLFLTNTKNNPGSANAYDSLGDFYVAKGDKQKAIDAFTKSLSLQETLDTRRKLNDLKAGK